jgi:hypothetical protein
LPSSLSMALTVTSSAIGPKRRKTIVPSNVGYWGLSGLVVLTLSFVGHDPKRP